MAQRYCKVKSNTGGIMAIKYVPELTDTSSKLILLTLQEAVCKLECMEKRLTTLIKHLEIITDEDINNDDDQ